MQIHELDTFVGTLGADVFFAVDDGTETTKLPANNIQPTPMTEQELTDGTETAPRVISPAVLSELKVLVIEKADVNDLPVNISNTSITSDMVCLKSELSNLEAQTADWVIQTFNGELSINAVSGVGIAGGTDIKLYLVKSK